MGFLDRARRLDLNGVWLRHDISALHFRRERQVAYILALGVGY